MSIPFRRRGLVFAVVFLVAACGKAPPPAEAPRPVLTAVLGSTAQSHTETYSGEVRSRYEMSLAFRLPGKIAARLVDTGAQVSAGTVLARLDPADTALAVASANAQLDLAAADLRRYRELVQKHFVSQSALDAKETAFTAARAQADLSRNQSAYTVLRSEHAGVVELVAAEVGQVVAAGQTVMRVARTDTLEVALNIPETAVADIRRLQDAEISLWADEKAAYKGRLRELSPTADPLTRTYAVRVTIINADARVLLGMTANVRFLRDAGEASLSVPLSAIFQQDGKAALWIVGADQTLALRPVSVVSYGETHAVLAAGAQVGERFVVAGVHKLNAGERIRAVEPTPYPAR
jgi:RND family efflux transporter MFP subunit